MLGYNKYLTAFISPTTNELLCRLSRLFQKIFSILIRCLGEPLIYLGRKGRRRQSIGNSYVARHQFRYSYLPFVRDSYWWRSWRRRIQSSVVEETVGLGGGQEPTVIFPADDSHQRFLLLYNLGIRHDRRPSWRASARRCNSCKLVGCCHGPRFHGKYQLFAHFLHLRNSFPFLREQELNRILLEIKQEIQLMIVWKWICTTSLIILCPVKCI